MYIYRVADHKEMLERMSKYSIMFIQFVQGLVTWEEDDWVSGSHDKMTAKEGAKYDTVLRPISATYN